MKQREIGRETEREQGKTMREPERYTKMYREGEKQRGAPTQASPQDRQFKVEH